MIYDYDAFPYLIDVGVPGMTITEVIRNNLATQHCEPCDVRWYGEYGSSCWCCGEAPPVKGTTP